VLLIVSSVYAFSHEDHISVEEYGSCVVAKEGAHRDRT
jgi:hypothetical protein